LAGGKSGANAVHQEVTPLFSEVTTKLELARYFLDNLKALAAGVGGLAYIKKEELLERRANLDGFFFEIVSVKDFFLQKINDRYEVGLPKNEATTKLADLKRCLEEKDTNASKVVGRIQRLLSIKNSWLWTLNNYRNSATHRELIHLEHSVLITPEMVERNMFEKIRRREVYTRPILEGEEIASGAVRLDIPIGNVKTYLLRDPEDPSQGHADMEVIPYCEQSLERMRNYLEELYSKLSI